jgi:hypothetical protein
MKKSVLPFVETSILLASAVGFAMSLVLSAWGISIAPAPLDGPMADLGRWTLLAEFPVGLLFVLRLQARERVEGSYGGADYSGCPRWLRLASYAFMAAGVLLFFYPAILQFSGVGPVADGSTLPSTLPGGFGLLANSSLFAQTYSMSMRRRVAADASACT